MAKIDHAKLAEDIVDIVGTDNIDIVSHCMTRLRFNVKNIDAVDQEKIKGLGGVLGVIYSGGQLMVILGQNLLPVFEYITKNYSFKQDAAVDENLDEKFEWTPKNVGNAVLSYIIASVTPLIPGLIAGGMLKVMLVLINLVYPDFAATNAYTLLSMVGDAPFYFMPIFVAFGAAQKLGATPIYAMVGAASLIHGNFLALVTAGDPVTFFSVPVRLVTYTSSLLPGLLIALVACYVEKLMNKIVPGIFKSIFVGLGTISITMFFGYTILGPLGAYAGDLLSGMFVFLGSTVGPVAIGILAAFLPWLVMTGMHTALIPFMAQAIASPGYDPIFRPAFLLHNMSEGGACLGVALRTKDKEFRSETISLAIGCLIAGVTEPAIYGVNLRYKKPMIGVMAGGLCGGVVAGLLGARAYEMGYSNLLALPIFEDTLLAMASAVAVAVVVSAAVTFILGIEDGSDEARSDNGYVDVDDDAIVAVADGTMIDIADVKDEAFSSKAMGDGVAFSLAGDVVCAPCNGELTTVFPTGHAFGITRPDGVELLVHIGVDTVNLNGKGFTILVKQGETVKAGTPIVRLDMQELKKSGYDLTTMLIVTDNGGKDIAFSGYGNKALGEQIAG